MNNDAQRLQGACHCGAVRFQVRLTDGLNTARRCNCSYCRMRGAIAVSAALQDIDITSGEELLTLYQFNTMQAKHYFCSKCGIYTHHQRRSKPEQYGINVACLEGISPFDFEEVPVNEGRIHPKDKGAGGGPVIAGYLRYFPDTTR
ncbi:MAG: GFA family protein [Telluria sp.]